MTRSSWSRKTSKISSAWFCTSSGTLGSFLICSHHPVGLRCRGVALQETAEALRTTGDVTAGRAGATGTDNGVAVVVDNLRRSAARRVRAAVRPAGPVGFHPRDLVVVHVQVPGGVGHVRGPDAVVGLHRGEEVRHELRKVGVTGLVVVARVRAALDDLPHVVDHVGDGGLRADLVDVAVGAVLGGLRQRRGPVPVVVGERHPRGDRVAVRVVHRIHARSDHLVPPRLRRVADALRRAARVGRRGARGLAENRSGHLGSPVVEGLPALHAFCDPTRRRRRVDVGVLVEHRECLDCVLRTCPAPERTPRRPTTPCRPHRRCPAR